MIFTSIKSGSFFLYNWMQQLNRERSSRTVHEVGQGEESIKNRRSQSKLAQEFDDFKRTIQKFQNESNATINKIRQSYNLKKQHLAEEDAFQDSKKYLRHTMEVNTDNYWGKQSDSNRYNPLSLKTSVKNNRTSIMKKYRQDSKSVIERVIDRDINDYDNDMQKMKIFAKRQSDLPLQRKVKSNNTNEDQNFTLENVCTEQSDLIEEEDLQIYSNVKEQQFQDREKVYLKRMIELLQTKCSEADKRNQELCQYIKKKQYKQSKERKKVDLKPFVNNVKGILDDFFFQVNEEFLAQKFFTLQREVKKVDSKLKNVAFRLNSYKEQKSMRKIGRKKSSLFQKKSYSICSDGSSDISRISIEQALRNETEVCRNPNCFQEVINKSNQIGKLKDELSQLHVCLEAITKEKSESQHANTINLIKIDKLVQQNQHLVEQNIENLSVLRAELEKKIQQKDEKLSQEKQKVSSLQIQIKVDKEEKANIEHLYQQKVQQLTFEISSLESNISDLEEKVSRKNEEIAVQGEQIENLNKKIMEKEKEVLAVNSKMRTLENQLELKEKKLQNFESITFKEQSRINISFPSTSSIEKSKLEKVDVFFEESTEEKEPKNDFQLYPMSENINEKFAKKPLKDDVVKEYSQLLERSEVQSYRYPEARKKNTFIEMLDCKQSTIFENNQKSSLIAKNLQLEERNSFLESQLKNVNNIVEMFQNENNKISKEKANLLKQLEEKQRQFSQTKQKRRGSVNEKGIVSQKSIELSLLKSLNYSQPSDGGAKKDKKQVSSQQKKAPSITGRENVLELLEKDETIKHLKDELKVRNEGLIFCLKENQTLRLQMEQLVNENRQSQGVKRSSAEEVPFIDNFKFCKQSKIYPSNENTLKENLSFRLSFQNSDILHQSLNESFDSNISEIFKQDEILQHKIKEGKTTRKEQIILFEKTSAYIKSLKEIIDEKEFRIKQLEKELKLMKKNHQGELTSEQKYKNDEESPYCELQKQNSYCSSPEKIVEDEEQDSVKEYQSFQIDIKKAFMSNAAKRDQAEKEFLIEENKVLQNQLNCLREELQSTEEQEKRLMNIKDLLKEQLRKQAKDHEAELERMETQIERVKERLQESGLHHNMEALKQLFVKMVEVFKILEQGSARGGRREQKKRQFDEYVKVMCNILELQQGLRNKLLGKR